VGWCSRRRLDIAAPSRLPRMFQSNVDRILASLSPSDVVLDIDGWACPFNRANIVLDAAPYETRGHYGSFGGPPFQGPERESFTRETWIQRDICDRTPFPFGDRLRPWRF
jgi:hypothetical protein